jgi:hypothetical protein
MKIRPLVLALLAPLPGCGVSEADCQAIATWLATLNLQAGTQQNDVALPANLARLSANGTVHAAKLPSGRLCFVLKRSIGYKENWTGIAWCDGAPDPGAVKNNQLTLGDPPLEEIFIRRVRAPHRFDVYFDLN